MDKPKLATLPASCRPLRISQEHNCRVSGAPAESCASDPKLEIKVDQIDPQIAQVIADALEVSYALKKTGCEETRCASQGTDQVVIMSFEGEVAIQFSEADPPRRPARPRRDVYMPYCDEPAEGLWQAIGSWLAGASSGGAAGVPVPFMPYAQEYRDAFMPYATEDMESNTEPQEESTEDEIMPDSMEEEDIPQPDEVIPHPVDPHHHHHEMICPHHHGQYCPRPYYRPYPSRPAPEPKEAEELPEPEQQEEPVVPAPAKRTSFWFNIFGSEAEVFAPFEAEIFHQQPINWDREDSLRFPSEEKIG
jgi:hypothetical protein